MSRTFVQPGDMLSLTAPSGGVTAGTPVLIGSLLVIPQSTVAQTLPFEGMVVGVHTLAKTSAQAWTEGQAIYWNASTSKLDSDSATGQLVGVAAAAADNPSATGVVRLNGVAPALSEGPQVAIANMTAISGGEAPSETEHNLVITKINALLASLRISGLIAP